MEIESVKLLSAQKLRSLICSSGKSQEQIAADCKCSDRQIRNWTKRDTDVHVSHLFALADEFEVAVDNLLISLPLPDKRE